MISLRLPLWFVLPTLAIGCGSSAAVDAPNERPNKPIETSADGGGLTFPVEIGTPDELVQSTFVELEEDGDVKIQDGGQGGTHALVALRYQGLGQWIYYQIAIRDPEGGGEVETPALVRPRPTKCDEDLFECHLSPILVVIGGLADKEVWDGLHVEIRATVTNEAGDEGAIETTAYLRR